ncbi:polymorphic toxin-type HINT domain-containing protein [Streptomyces sp. NBC_01465]|uniref:polymorphic toxin-type HINT domain-containing protein n=1 Tax=Streptomyces sp. NBC_01465 TaxID=2903878 RepID=UPI002E309AEE|nr:polymorphic toxin-type HINT domain-containing protein [Streptomyces sp. NBC_01465]
MTNSAVYAYDAAGRMVGVTDPAGETARYRYDATGNRLGVDRYPSSQLSVLSIVPARAAAGTRVTISGTGFAPSLTGNTVTFGGGKTATVATATATRLTVTVPAAAGTGTVAVKTGTTTVSSSEPFSLAGPGPAITAMSPATGPASTQVALTGSGFAAADTDNVVRFNGLIAVVVSRTATALTVKVPPGASSGQVTLDTPDGQTNAPKDFTVPSTSNVEATVRTTATDTAPVPVAVSQPGKIYQVLFGADRGDDVSFGFTGSTFSAVTLRLVDPQGATVDTTSIAGSAPNDWDLRHLPLSGTYSLYVEPNSNGVGSASLVLSEAAGGALDYAAAPSAAAMTRAGQNTRWTFTATAGDSVSLGVDALQMTSVNALLYAPNGDKLTERLIPNKGADSIDLDSVPQTGTYELVLDPYNAATGTAQASVSNYSTGGVATTTGPAVQVPISRPGQNGTATFQGQLGQQLSLGMAATGFTTSLPVTIKTPSGTVLETQTAWWNSPTEWELKTLPTTGTYTIVVAPTALGTGQLSLTLSQTATLAALTTGAAPAKADIPRFGQNLESTFQATTGDDLSLGLSANTVTTNLLVSVINPSGSTLINQRMVYTGQSGTIGLSDLPETGTYRIVIDPYQGGTGSLYLTLSVDIGNVVQIDGASALVSSTRPGQRLRATFTAPAGGMAGLALTSNTFTDTTNLTLLDASGALVKDLGTVSKATDGAKYFAALTAGATYTVLLEPTNGATGTGTLWLSAPVNAGALPANASPVTGALTRPGQQLLFTLQATAGEGAAVLISNSTFTGVTNIVTQTSAGASAGPAVTLTGATGETDLRPPLQAGTYQVLLQPAKPVSGNATASRVNDINGGTLTVGGARVPAAITAAAGNAHYTFAGTKGQKITTVVDAPPYDWELSVAGPDGKWLVDARYVAKATLSVDLPALTADGTYTVTVDPYSRATGTITLGAKVTGTLAKTPATADKPTTPPARAHTDTAPGIVPTGADAWQPDQRNLSGRDWTTHRGAAPAALPALRAPPGQTSLTGRVLKLDGTALPGVTVTVANKTARTDSSGRFLLAGISAQARTVVVDGSSANSRSRQYGTYSIRITPRAGRAIDLGFPVWMTPLDTKHTVTFTAPARTDVVLKTPQIPGLEVHIPKGSVIRDAKGNTVTKLGITAIPTDRTPFPLPKDSQVPVYFTVQPGGTTVFPKGAQIIYPNYTQQTPGHEMDFLNYDPADKGWHVYGHGKVSADGRQVIPDKNTRVWAFNGAMISGSATIPFDIPLLDDVVDWLSGDPVDLHSGLLTDTHTDLAVGDELGNAEVTRSYWQGDTRSRAFGIGRDLSYNARLFRADTTTYRDTDLYLPGGRTVHFVRTSPGTHYDDAVFEPTDSSSDFQGTRIQYDHTANHGGWNLTFRDGTVWFFPEYAPLAEIRDRHGNNLRLTRTDAPYGDVIQAATSSGRWVSLTYDAQHRVSSTQDNTGRTTAYTYDTTGRLDTVTDPAGKISRFTYDGTSNRIATANDARAITYMTNTYYADGRVKDQTLTEGAKFSFTYDKNGSGQVTATNVTQPGGSIRRVEFDASGMGTSDTEAYNTTLARKTLFGRGTRHRVDTITDPYNRRTDFTYDANGNITSTTDLAGTADARSSGTETLDGPFDQPTQSTDTLGNATLYTYETNGDLKSVSDPEGRTTTYTYAPDGQVKTVTDADGVTEFTYRFGQLVSVKDAEGRISSQFTDAAGRPSATSDPSGATTAIVYDKLSQVRQTTDPMGFTTGYAYDDNGNLTGLTDARTHTASWGYDNADRLKSATDALGNQSTFGYDAAGNLAKATTRAGKVATAEFDLLGRQTKGSYGVTTTGTAESTATYTYNDFDLPQTITDTAAGNESFTYDPYDQVKTATSSTGTVTYGYDSDGRRASLAAAGVTTTYGYDKSSALTSLTTGSDQIVFGLDAVGRQKTAALPGGFTRTTDYDKTGNTKNITYTRAGATVGTLAYGRDERSLQTSLTGNLANIALPAAETGTTFGVDNQISTYAGRTFTYNKDGQLSADGIRTYTWNARGQLTGLTKAGQSSTFGYDPLGARTSRTTAGATSKFLTDGSNPLVEQNSSGQITGTVVTGGLDDYLTRSESGKNQVYLTDAQGSVVGLANSDGTIATTYTYDPAGQATATGAATGNRYTYTGREDDGTGLLYYRDRYYDPQTGRFISQDPIGQAGGSNLYEYAMSSPTTYTDPSGDNPLLVGCLVGGLTDGAIDWLTQRLSGRKVNWGQVGASAVMGCLAGMIGGEFGGGWASRGVCTPNSFTGDTPVVMADGTRRPIKDIKVGDRVLATDPETGETGAHNISTLIRGTGDKQLVDITIDTDGPAGSKTGLLTATDGHPFWVPELHQWVPASQLTPGQWLQTSSGTWVQVEHTTHRRESTRVYNFTVDDLHTYFVGAGNRDVLVHNKTCLLGTSVDINRYLERNHYRGGFYKLNVPMRGSGRWNWTLNKRFIDHALKKGIPIRLVTNPNNALYKGGNVTQREIRYLMGKGYGFRKIENYWLVVKIRP